MNKTLLTIHFVFCYLISPAYSDGLQVLKYQCGACHISSLKTSLKGALNVFDFDDKQWTNKLTEKQRKEIISRTRDRIGMNDLEVSYLMPRGYKPLPKRPSKKDIEEVRDYLEKNKLSSPLKLL